MTDTVHTLANGKDHIRPVPHRLGDYFADIRILPTIPATHTSFRLVFQKLPEAGRFWKDLMVNIIQEIEKSAENASISLDYKGDEEPVATTANR